MCNTDYSIGVIVCHLILNLARSMAVSSLGSTPPSFVLIFFPRSSSCWSGWFPDRHLLSVRCRCIHRVPVRNTAKNHQDTHHQNRCLRMITSWVSDCPPLLDMTYDRFRRLFDCQPFNLIASSVARFPGLDR